ncbi:MAG: RNA polymerase sporulation sigma factor SigK [Candidatus Fimadaptatus sp.]
MLEFLLSIWFIAGYISARSSFPQPLSAEEERRALERMAEGDAEARRLLIEHNMRLVAHISKKYLAPGQDSDDLISIGAIGLIKAVDTYRPGMGTQLSTYAARCVENEVLMCLRASRKMARDVSLEEPIGSDREGNDIMLIDVLGTDGDEVEAQAQTHLEMARALRHMKKLLSTRELTVLELRYGLRDGRPHAQHEVAAALGISRSYVSRIEKRALARVREAMEARS